MRKHAKKPFWRAATTAKRCTGRWSTKKIRPEPSELAALAGQAIEWRSDLEAALAEAVVGILCDAFGPASDGRDVQTTVEVRDIERATYAKHPPGTISTPPLR